MKRWPIAAAAVAGVVGVASVGYFALRSENWDRLESKAAVLETPKGMSHLVTARHGTDRCFISCSGDGAQMNVVLKTKLSSREACNRLRESIDNDLARTRSRVESEGTCPFTGRLSGVGRNASVWVRLWSREEFESERWPLSWFDRVEAPSSDELLLAVVIHSGLS